MSNFSRMMKAASRNPYCTTCQTAFISRRAASFVGNYLEKHLISYHGFKPRRHWWQYIFFWR